MSTNTSIGPDAEGAGNEDHGNADGCGNKTLGENAKQQVPAGAQDGVDEARSQVPPGVPGVRSRSADH
jgi:hypothetical protein